MTLLDIFANNLLPILLLGGAGFVLGKVLSIDPKPLGRVIFYILSPLLVFNLVYESQLSIGMIAGMMGYAAAVMLTVAGLAWLAGRILRLERVSLAAVVITAMVANNGNYGLPLIGFAFGEEALAFASIYFVTSSLLLNTLGVTVASLGRKNLKDTLLGLLKVPAIYAILLAILFVQTSWKLPEPLHRTVSLAAGGSIPAMLVLLGLELTRVQWSKDLRALSIPVVARLVIGPLVGWAYTGVFGLTGVARQDGIVDAALPTAVMTTVLASEYNIKPELVTAIVFVSTILSPFTLTPLLYFLGR